MVNPEFLTQQEQEIYSSTVTAFFNVNVDANKAMEVFSNPAVAANLKSATAFIEAALTLMEFENDLRRLKNGNNKSNDNDTAATA